MRECQGLIGEAASQGGAVTVKTRGSAHGWPLWLICSECGERLWRAAAASIGHLGRGGRFATSWHGVLPVPAAPTMSALADSRPLRELLIRFFKRGLSLIVLGILALLLVGFCNPTADALDLAYRYSPLYLAAISAVAVGLLMEL